MEQIEIWKPVVGYEHQYEVSDKGGVRGIERKVVDTLGRTRIRESVKLLWLIRSGYAKVGIGTKQKTVFVHRLVACAFIPNPENKKQVNHIDGNKLNNHVSNLEWCTPGDNQRHAYRTGLKKKPQPWLGKFGIKNPASKQVAQYDLLGNYIKTYAGASEAARDTKSYSSEISLCARGLRNSARGFKYKYV